ncbi:Fe2+-dependent dioxygenase [Cupriavidus sp. 2TAF22]|uniref:Fe2+-dependent dioxygenase n=1 Tax=unclassified Cupriavidus TaxID=2640874 RepID=UPI003F9101BB
MMVHIPGVLTPEQVRESVRLLMEADWVDGKGTAGFQSALAKDNLQLPHDSRQGAHIAAMIEQALRRHPLFLSAALPARIYPKLFNAYQGGQSFGTHVDNAIRYLPDSSGSIRTDLSATLFLRGPDDYDGGELIVEDTYGTHAVKLPAGDMILYPASSLHRVSPVTRGTRLCSFFWIQSLVRNDARRALLFDLDTAVQETAQALGHGHATTVRLTGVYHNLLREWATP